MTIEMKPIDSAPKDGTTIIATGGWYDSPVDGQHIVNAPSLIAWKDDKWVMMDDHGAEYHDPAEWTPVP
jgi:hypothetical protein